MSNIETSELRKHFSIYLLVYIMYLLSIVILEHSIDCARAAYKILTGSVCIQQLIPIT